VSLLILVLPAFVATAEPTTFESHVKPVVRKHCLTCHNPERPRGELDLSTYAAALVGGVSGKAVIAGKPEESPLYTMSAHLESPKMPPNKPKIPEKDLDVLKKWIEGGLVEKVGPTTAETVPGKSDETTAVKPADGLQVPLPLARSSAITALAVSPTASLAALPGLKQILIHDLTSSKLLGAVLFPEGEVHALRFTADGKLLLAGGGIGGQSGQVVAFDTTTWKRVFTVGDEADAVLACDLSPDGSQVVLGGPTRNVKVYTVADGKVKHTFRKPTDWVTAVGFSPDGLLIAAGDRFGSLFLWEADSGKEYAILRGHTKGITALSWRADGNALATASEDGTVRLWNAHTLAEEAKLTAHLGGVLDVRFHASGRLATGGRDGRARIWDGNGKALADFGPAADHVLKVAFTADGAGVLAGDWAGQVKAWHIDGRAATAIVRPLKPSTTVAVVLPAKPVPIVAAAPKIVPAGADDSLATALKNATTAELEVQQAKRNFALKTAAAALAHLKVALALEPDNAALRKAVAEATEAVRKLAPEPTR